MLILTRKPNESIIINGNIEIKIIEASDGRVRIGIDAPKTMEIHRKEIYEKIQLENETARKSNKALKMLENYMKSDKGSEE